jgi:DHA1 family tetracycline resistance protein-like MFS transporter
VGVGAAVVQGGLARRVIPAIGERAAVLIGFTLAALAYAGYGAATEGWMIYAVIAFATFGGIAQPAAQSLITRAVSPLEQGAVQGAMTGLQSVANILGPIIGSTVFSYAVSGRMSFSMPGLSFFVGSAMAMVGLIIAALTLRTHAASTAA